MSATPIHRPFVFWGAAALTAASIAAIASLTLLTPKSVASPVEPPDSPLSVAEAMDSIVQPRFFQLGDEVFGMSRIARTAKNHPLRRFVPESETEKVYFDKIAASGRDCHILFYQTVPALVDKPAFSRGNDPLRYIISNTNAFRWEMLKDFKPVIEEELTRLKTGEKRTRDTKDYVLAMRPVHSANACVSCHSKSGAKDILGVMVYVISKERRAVTRPAQPVQQQQVGWKREVEEVVAAK